MAPEDAPNRAPPRRRFRTTPLAIAGALVAVAAIVLIGTGRSTRTPPGSSPTTLTGSAGSESASSVIVGSDRGYLVSLDELRARAARAAAGTEPEATALADLLAWAATAVDGNPDPKEPLRIDGTTGSFVDDSATAYGLALAWGVSGDLRDATAARRFVNAWVERTRTLVGACPTGGDCQTSLVVSRAAPGFVFAVDLLTPSGVLTADDLSAFHAWLSTVILPAASQRTNNWGDAGVFLRVVATDALGDTAGFSAAIDAWRAQLDLVAADGHIPEEVRRGSSGLSYTQEALMYKLAVAVIAGRRGIDLWNVRGAGGGTLKSAVEFDARYQLNSAGWPYASPVDVPATGPGWELAYAEWPEPAFVSLLEPVRPLGWPGHSAVRWTTLTNGIPFGG